MVRSKPIYALRFLTLSVTILLVAVLYLAKGSTLVAFIGGLATGLSIAAQTVVWNKQLQWHDEPDHSDTIQLSPTEPRR